MEEKIDSKEYDYKISMSPEIKLKGENEHMDNKKPKIKKFKSL